MTLQQTTEPIAASVEQPLSAQQPPHRPRQLKGWRTVKELTAELRFCSERACRAWLARHQVPNVRRGRIILIDGLDIDAILRKRA